MRLWGANYSKQLVPRSQCRKSRKVGTFSKTQKHPTPLVHQRPTLANRQHSVKPNIVCVGQKNTLRTTPSTVLLRIERSDVDSRDTRLSYSMVSKKHVLDSRPQMIVREVATEVIIYTRRGRRRLSLPLVRAFSALQYFRPKVGWRSHDGHTGRRFCEQIC